MSEGLGRSKGHRAVPQAFKALAGRLSAASYSDGIYETVPAVRDEKEARRALRPSIPALAVCAVAYWGGIACAEALTWEFYCDRIGGELRWICIAMGLLFAAALAALVWMLRRERSAVPLRLAAAFLLGLFVGCCFWMQWEDRAERCLGEGGRHRIELVGDAQGADFGYCSDARYQAADGSVLPVTVYWSHEGDIAAAGEAFWTFGSVKLPSSDEARRLAHMNARYGSISVYMVQDKAWAADARGLLGPAREQIRSGMRDIGGEGSALMQGVVLGDRAALVSTEVKQSFQICGLSHLIAVSGTHLIVVCALFSWFLDLLPLDRRLRAAWLFAAVSGYLVLSGLQISAVRAAVMLAAGLMGQMVGRKKDSLTACALCCMGVLSLTPQAALSISFILSVAAVSGIVIFSPYVESWLACLLKGRLRPLCKPLALTLVAQAVTLPVTVPAFSTLSLAAPLANIIVAPLVSALLVLGLVAGLSCLFLPAAGAFLLSLGAALGNSIAQAAHMLAQIPYASVAVAVGSAAFTAACIAALLAVWTLWPTPTRRRAGLCAVAACMACAALAATSLLPSAPQLIMLDVGQGDALVLRDGRHTLLIDTGEADAGLARQLAKNGIHALDAIVITHLHTDHYAALASLAATVPTEAVYFSAPTQEEEHASCEAVCMASALVGEGKVGYLDVGDSVILGHFTLEVISPKTFTDDGGNADSLCLTLCFDAQADGVPESSALLVGDAEADTLAPLVKAGAVQGIDLLKVGHHGSAESLSSPVAEALDPSVALISVGAGNAYGHPNAKTVELLEAQGAAVYRTDQRGDITVTFSKDTLHVGCDTMTLDGL